jgi:glycosyltransferase involved in cell wall biosynthesis
MSRPRIAWFSPVQPIESGISLYSEDIVLILGTVLDIDVIVDHYTPSVLRNQDGVRIRSLRDYNPANYDLVVYQLGNSPVHIYMLEEIYRNPGLLVLHDTMLNHLFIQQAARNGTLSNYRAEMERRYGRDGVRAADRVLKGQAPDDLFQFPMSEPLIELNRATIVHSEFARQQSLSWVPDAQVVRVPHGLHPPQEIDRDRAKQTLGIPTDQMLIASVSHINPHKRIDVVLRALKQVRRQIPARLILAGSVSPNFPLERMISHLGLEQVVDVPGYVSDPEARLIAAAADVIVNLRFPTAGETSGSLLHSMAAGRPVLVSETGSFAEVPRDSVISIPVDSLEESMLVAVFEKLWNDESLRNSIGINARDFVLSEHSIQRWVNGYADVISELTGSPLGYPDFEIHYENVPVTSAVPNNNCLDDLTGEIAVDIAELGLGGDERLLRDIASAQVELGLGVGMIKGESGD